MLNKFKKKGVSLLEGLVAMLLLGLISVVYFNSSKLFMSTQQSLVTYDRQEQLAELIIQGLMEYTKQDPNIYGDVTANGEQILDGFSKDIDININLNDEVPEKGDMFLISSIKGKHIIDDIDTSGATATITTVKNIASGTIDDASSINFIAFNKDKLECFNGLDLTVATSAISIDGCDTIPTEVSDLHEFWLEVLSEELGADYVNGIASIEVTDGGLVKVSLGRVVLARSINTCLFTQSATSAKFVFPGMDEPLITGIMVGSESPIKHYNFSNKGAKTYDEGEDGDNLPGLDGTTEQGNSCGTRSASTCRQNYSKKDTITVFLYRYDGATPQWWKPTGCVTTLDGATIDWQCPAVEVESQDLSLWFIFDAHQSDLESGDHNDNGFINFESQNLPENAKILIFDDASESCQQAITDNKCTGKYKWGGAHDGLVIHLGTGDLNSLADIGLEILTPTYGIDKWRVLKSDIPTCLIASGDPTSTHGDWDTAEADMPEPSCWQDVLTNQTQVVGSFNRGDMSLVVDNSAVFQQVGTVQIENELVSYSAIDTDSNTLTVTERGIKQCTNCTVVSGNPNAGGIAIASTQNINANNIASITLSGDPGVGFYGGYLRIGTADNYEVFEVDYNSSFNNFDNHILSIRQRALFNTSSINIYNGAHALGDGVLVTNWDNEEVDHSNGKLVVEGNEHTKAAIMPVVGGSYRSRWRNGDQTGYTVSRIKNTINLNLSDSAVCN